MRMHDLIIHFGKGIVFENYSRIVEEFKDYDKITKVKMLDEIYNVYDNPDNIIDICTTKELKYLKKVLNNEIPESSKSFLVEDEYEWEVRNLRSKFLLDFEKNIPEEVIDKVKEALKKVNWTEKKEIDELNELLVVYCKIQGTALLTTVCEYASAISGIDTQKIWEHMLDNKLFNYYVFITGENIEGLGKDIPIAIYQDYLNIQDEIRKQREKQGLAGTIQISQKMVKTLFYNDFDINNPKIKKLLDEIKQLPFNYYQALEMIKEYAMLNKKRDSLKETIQNAYYLKNMDLTELFKTLDAAMDEMPSGVLNGMSPNQIKKIETEKVNMQINKTKRYVKQENACLSQKDADLFYKIYFALLEFTNKKYKINNNIKIYKQEGINPYDITDIIDKYWENKEQITVEFCKNNPFKFTEEELKLASEFKKGKRSMFIICKYELEYTAFMELDRIYMIKGINANIDEIIPYNTLPKAVITSIIPFKDNLIYDGILSEFSINLGINLEKAIENEYNSMMKYYHL